MSPNFDPKFIDASDWQVLPWYNSGGTRAKRVLQDDHGKLWYFKCSARKAATENKPEKYYKYEFWSEVIAYQLGNALGLDILRYDAAAHAGEMGCISPLMIDQDDEQLVEIGRYMTVINPGFNPDDRKTHSEYSFEFLVETLEYFDQVKYLDVFLKTMLFDALIGNSDRHQENWAFIARSTFKASTFEPIGNVTEATLLEKLPRWIRWLPRWLFKIEKNVLTDSGKLIHLLLQDVIKMAPIYDNGSSMGRELPEERITRYLGKQDEFNNYVENGKSELHWKKNKISHISMIQNLLGSAYLEQLLAASTFLQGFNEQYAEMLVHSIDEHIPPAYSGYCLSADRKKFITKLLCLRAQKLKGIIDNGRV